jgi:ABC-type branched-subunit amino acid transport system ATPase component
MARTFQESPAVRHLTVFEHLQLSCEATAGSRAGLQSAAPEELLTRFGLEDSKDRLGGELPTTDRRLLDLARAVGTGPKVLLLDEPFSGLESDQVRLVMREIERLQANAVSVLIVEHRLALLGSIAQSVVAILAGTPVAQGSLAEVLHNPEVQAAFLGPEIRAEKADHANPVDR